MLLVAGVCVPGSARSQATRPVTPSSLSPGTVAPLVTPPPSRVLPPEQPEILPPPAPSEEAGPATPGPPVQVDTVRIEGSTVYSPESLRPLYADVVGKPVPRARLDEIVEALQTRYRSDGYILTLVRGRFEKSGPRLIFVIRAIEGYISDVKLDGNIGPAAVLVLRMLQHLTEKRPVKSDDLERYLLLANDVPGVTARAILRRQGSEPGAVELVAQLSRRAISGLLNFDNRGPPEAGPPEMLLSGSTNSLTNFGERLTAMLYTTFNREEIFGQVNGDAFLGSEGLQLRSYYGRGDTQPGGILAAVGYDGQLEIGGASLSYPLVRSRRLNFSVDLAVDNYNSLITLAGGGAPSTSGSYLWSGRLGGRLDYQDLWLFQVPAADAVELKFSQGMLGTSSARVGNDVHFTKLTGQITRTQNLFTIGSVATALKSAIAGQYTSDILPPSEKFFLGGVQFGRGFYNGEVTGDRALGASLEFQENTGFTNVPLLNPGYRLSTQFYQFWDYGRAYNLAPGDLDFTIQSIGLGIRSDLTPWLFLDLEGVHRLTVHPQGPTTPRDNEYAFFTTVTMHY